MKKRDNSKHTQLSKKDDTDHLSTSGLVDPRGNNDDDVIVVEAVGTEIIEKQSITFRSNSFEKHDL